MHRGCRQLDSPSLQKSHCGPLPLPHSLTFPLGQRRRGSRGRRTQPPRLKSVFTRTSDLWARPFPPPPRTLPAPLAAQGLCFLGQQPVPRARSCLVCGRRRMSPGLCPAARAGLPVADYWQVVKQNLKKNDAAAGDVFLADFPLPPA